MACHRRRWSSEPSSAQILYQICKLLQLLFPLLPLAVIIPLFLPAAFFSSFTLFSSDEICRRQEQSLAHSPQDGHLVPFPLLLTPSTQVSTLEVELGSLDSCSLERCECVESHLISSTSSSFGPQAPDGPAC